MQIDDRLGTVLRARAEGPALERIQYRQLIDLLGTRPAEGIGAQMVAAYERLAALSRSIPPTDRAGIIADPGLRLRSLRLVALLASDSPQVAAAAVRQAQLSEEQWLDLVPALPVAARGAVRERRGLGPRVEALVARLGIGKQALPDVGVIEGTATEVAAQPGESEGIGAIVRRIEAYRRAREIPPPPANSNDAPRLPLGEDHVLQAPARVDSFDFVADASGRITWADPGVAPMVVGSLPFDGVSLGGTAPLQTALRRRQPLRARRLMLHGAPALAGAWQADAMSRFDPQTGNFTGFAGRMRRLVSVRSAPDAPRLSAAEREADRIRQLLHELRTPIGAIQGFAETIQQQIFGPAPHEYRALAASIAGDAARVLAAFEELERYAKLESAALDIEAGACDFAELVAQIVARIAPFGKQRNSGFDARYRKGSLSVAIAPIEAERIAWRVLATLAGTSGPGEVLLLKLSAKSGGVKLKIELPALLASRDDKALFGATVGALPQSIASGMFGVGFALRLARTEARAAGGSLERDGKDLILWLPGLTTAGTPNNPPEDAGKAEDTSSG